MSNELRMVLMVLLMALVTYLIRSLPMVLIKKKIHSPFLYSFLHYIPYAVLAAMTFPHIILYLGYDTKSIIAATVGTVVAMVSALFKCSLIVVAILASLSVLLILLVF